MAIQLNERDELIFNLIEEHQVLLEKHIAWFISGDQKPVLIRDRLRKLFYLDYLLCQRHPNTLPWWTTPTKPLVYTLSPMTRSMVGAGDSQIDINDSDLQRHLLEVANLRMLFLVGRKEGSLSKLDWKTLSLKDGTSPDLDASVSFGQSGIDHRVGIINHPPGDPAILLSRIESALKSSDCGMIWIVCRDEAHQQMLQQILATASPMGERCAFATHQDLYKNGIVRSNWENCEQRPWAMFPESLEDAKSRSSSIRPQAATA